MSNLSYKIIVDKDSTNSEYCNKIISSIDNKEEISYLAEEEITKILSEPETTDIAKNKQTLIFTKNKGSWLKACPGTTGNYLCCNYQILNFASNCNMNCTYCILQAYFQHSKLLIFSNTDSMFKELDEKVKNRIDRPFLRIGTGEFTDSLCIDDITGFSKLVIPYFTKLDNAILELKTKSVKIDNLLKLDPKQKIVASWSMNSERINKSEELDTTSLEERLIAARKCEDAGYWLGFHFDPIIIYEGWEEEYEEVVNRIFDAVKNPDHIAWISLGCLRYPPFLNDMIKNRYPDSKLPYGEFIMGNDNKMRYFKPLRVEVYKKMNNWIKKRSKNVPVYLCMESSSVWKSAFGMDVRSNKPIADLLDNSVRRKYA